MGFYTNIRGPSAIAVTTTTSSTSVGLTIPGASGQCIYLTSLSTNYTGAAQTSNQLTKIFDGSTEVYRVTGLTGTVLAFYVPLRISAGNNLVATLSVSVNTIAGNIYATYYQE